jgi:rSAM/selenodomain-associated transferase 2
MPEHFLSIIIPALNEAGTLAIQLRALQHLRSQGVYLTLVDGGSTDNTLEIARPLVDQVISTKPGRAIQMNAGARSSSAEVLLFLHADTLLPPSALALIRDSITAGALWGRFDVRINSPRLMLRIVERMMNWRSRLTGIATGDQGIFVSKNIFERVGGYPEQPLMEDIALSARLKRITPPNCFNESVITSGRRWEKHGILRTILLMWRLRAAYFFGVSPEKLAVHYGYQSPKK